MGLIKRLFGKKQAKDPEAVVLEPVLRKLNPFASGHDVKAQALIQHYRHWVFVCVSKISQAMASVPLRLYVTTNQGQKYNYIEQGKDTKSLLQREIDWLLSIGNQQKFAWLLAF